MSVRPQLRQRALGLSAIRQWMAERDILEVDTLALWPWANTDPNIGSMAATDMGWLHTSPEFGMKRLLSLGSGDIYQLSHVFRSEESGPLHRPEFMMLEFYRLGLDHQQLARETVELIQHLHSTFRRPRPREKQTSYRQLFLRHTGLDPFLADDKTLLAVCSQHGLQQWHGRQAMLDFLMATAIQPKLEADTLLVVHDYPPEQAALAQITEDQDGNPVAARFEVFLGGVELANGYHELSDGLRYRQRFEAENETRRNNGQPTMPLDEELCTLLELRPLPHCAGVAVGVDRLFMLLQGQADLTKRWPPGLDPWNLL